MATMDVSTASSALKTYYSSQRVQNMLYKDMVTFAMIPKYNDFVGKNYPLPLKIGNPQGRSSTFSNAQAQKTASVYRDFTLTRAKDYSLASIDSESWLASESNPGAFLKLATGEIDGAIDSLKRSLGWSIFGDATGALAAVASVTSANPAVITLSNPEDIVKFEVNQLLQARSGGTTRLFATGIATATVTNVDRDNGKITVNVDNSGNTDTIVAADTLNVVGDYAAKLTGLAGWIPSTTPSSSAFFGCDRSVDPSRLAGVRSSGAGKPLDEAWIDAARRVGREGVAPETGIMGFSRYASLEKTLGSRVQYHETEVAGVGFRGIKISGPTKDIVVYADRDCPDDKAYLLTMDTWGFYALKEPVMILDLDGNKLLREGSADAYEVRVATFSQMGCTFPGANAVISF